MKTSIKKKDVKKPAAEKNQIQLIKQERDMYLEGWQRAKADYKNLQERLSQDLTDARGNGKRETLLSLLPVIDNVEHAYGSVPEHLQTEPWVQGMSFIRQQFAAFLEEQGMQIINTNGSFDPELHEAIDREESDDASPGTILRVTRAGYRLDGNVLRPAAVIVAAEKESEEISASHDKH